MQREVCDVSENIGVVVVADISAGLCNVVQKGKVLSLKLKIL